MKKIYKNLNQIINKSLNNLLMLINIGHLVNKLKDKVKMTNIYRLTKKEINEYKLSRPMDLEKINSCIDLNRLRTRRRILFNKIIENRGSCKEFIEMIKIVQRLYDLGEPFYY